MKEDPTFVSARLSSNQLPVPAPRGNVGISGCNMTSGGNFDDVSDSDDNVVSCVKINGIKFVDKIDAEHNSKIDIENTPTRIEDECTEEIFDDDFDDDDDIPDEWKDDGEIHLIKRCQRMVQDDDENINDELVDENDPDYSNGGLWNEVIEEVEEEDSEGEDSKLGHFQEFDLEEVERDIRQKSRIFNSREPSSVTPSRYLNDKNVPDKNFTSPSKASSHVTAPSRYFEDKNVSPSRYYDESTTEEEVEKDRQSSFSQMKASVSVKDIAKLFETSTKHEETDWRHSKDLLSSKNLSKSSWKSMPNLGDDTANQSDDDDNHLAEQTIAAAIPLEEFEVCSKVPIRDRRSIFEQFSSAVGKVSRSWSIQNIHQTTSKSASIQNIHQIPMDSNSRKNQSFSQYLPNGAKPPMPLVGSNTPALRPIGHRDPPVIKGILKSFESRISLISRTKDQQVNPNPASLNNNKKTHDLTIAAYRWDDENNGEIYTEKAKDSVTHMSGNGNQMDLTESVDEDSKNPLYVVENGKEYRLVPLQQRRKLFEILNAKKEVDKNNVHDGAISSKITIEQKRKDDTTVPSTTNNKIYNGDIASKTNSGQKRKDDTAVSSFANTKIHNGAISSKPSCEENRKDETTVTGAAKTSSSLGKSVQNSSTNQLNPKLDCQTEEISNGNIVKCVKQGCQHVKNTNTNNDTVKSLNIPYIVEEQEVLQNIHIVKSLKNMFLKN